MKAQRAVIKDPFDPQVIAAARANGVSDAMIESAQKSPVYKFVKKWKLALPLHAEFRTLPMLFYVPPMLPVLAKIKDGVYDNADAASASWRPYEFIGAGAAAAALYGEHVRGGER